MQNVSAAWAMTSLSPSPLMVALVQSATSLPVFLVGLPAGAVADIVDRRRLLLVTQCWMLVAAGLLAVLTFVGLMTATTLLALTFALGVGVAMNAPTWQAITSELVPPSELTRAVTLNALPVNIGRAVGPALGGVLVAASGPALVFALNAVSFVAVLVVVYRWRREAPRALLPAERVIGATLAGIRYARHAPPLVAVLVRLGLFIVCASAFWALLPVITRRDLGLGAFGYGLLLGCLGVGAIAGAALLPRVKRRLPLDAVIGLATVVFAVVSALTAIRRWPLRAVTTLDLTPSAHWPEPHLDVVPAPDEGPVRVEVEYRIDPAQADAFALAIRDLEPIRRRDGAVNWAVYQDPGQKGRYVESFIVESWVEHLRQHERVTLSDRAVRSEEHTSELQSRFDLVCRLLLEKKKKDTLR